MTPIERSPRDAAPPAPRGLSIHARRIGWFLSAHVLVVLGLFAVAVQVGRSVPTVPFPPDRVASARTLPSTTAPAPGPLRPATTATSWSGTAPDVAAPWHTADASEARRE